MANDDDDPRDDEDLQDSIQSAISWLKWVQSVEQSQRDQEEESLEFQDAEGAWPSEVRDMRAATTVAGVPVPARPIISVATLDEPIALVAETERSATLSPRIHPLTGEADDDTAEVLAGIYRAIERDSNAEVARRWAFERVLWAGRGAYRINCEYDEEGGHPLDQKIVIKRVLYQGNVFFDPMAQEPDHSDGRRVMVVYDLLWPTYKERYPKSRLAEAEADQFTELSTDQSTQSWIQAGEGDEETRIIRVAEDWRLTIEKVPRVLLDDNTISDADDIPDGRQRHPTDKRSVPPREVRRVTWRTINAIEELDPEQPWDGQFIPIVPVIGRELQPVKGKRRWFGMVHNAKGSVRLVNYAASGSAEMAATEPRAPFMAPWGAFEGHEALVQQANIRNLPVIYYNPTVNGQPIPPPQRTQVDTSRLGPCMQLLSMGQTFIQTATAVHPPALGQDTPAFRSGVAINALQTQAMQSNAPYLSNLADISLMYEAKIILDLIPYKYDRPGRIARVLGKDGKTNLVALNQPFVPNGRQPTLLPYGSPDEQALANAQVASPSHPAKHYDLSKGRYGVEIDVGKSYADERQEGVTEMGAILQADPSFMQLIGPEYFQYRGEEWADQVAMILKKNRDHTMPWLADTPQPPVSPQQMQQMQQQIQQLQQALGQAAQEKQAKVVEQQGKLQIATLQEQAETQRSRESNEVKLAVAELSARVERLALFLEESRMVGTRAHEVATAGVQHALTRQESLHQRAHDVALGAADAAMERALSAQEHQQALVAAQAQPPQSPQSPLDMATNTNSPSASPTGEESPSAG